MAPKTKKNKRADHEWKEFEILVARIEKTLAPYNAIVKSPDLIPDKITGKHREIDATIRYNIGSTNILIIIECRHRKRVQDTLWIEQLHSKQKAVNAARCIAVSSSNFSEPAIKKASFYGIEIRLFRTTTPETIKSWSPFQAWSYNYKLINVMPSFGNIDFSGNEIDEELDKIVISDLSRQSKQFHSESPILIHNITNERISMRQLVEISINTAFHKMTKEERNKIEIGEDLYFGYSAEPEYYVNCSLGKKYLIGLGFGVIFYAIFDHTLLVTSVFEYSDENNRLVQGVEFDALSQDGKIKKLTVHNDFVTGSNTVTLWSDSKNKSLSGRVIKQNKYKHDT